MTTTTIADLCLNTQLTTAAQDIATAQSSELVYIGAAVFTNTSAANVDVTVWRLNTATTATTGSGGNWIAKRTIPPGRTWVCIELVGQVLGNSEVIQALASTTLVVNANISGTIDV